MTVTTFQPDEAVSDGDLWQARVTRTAVKRPPPTRVKTLHDRCTQGTFVSLQLS